MLSFTFIMLSVLLVLYAVFAFFWPKTKYRALQCTGVYFLAVWLINLAAQLSGSPGQSPLDAFFDSIIYSLQSFSLDASYNEILSNLAEGMYCPGFVHIYACFVLMIAPVVGGAAILTVLSNVFPILKFWIRSHRSEKIYMFSFLNEQSLSIAQALVDNRETGRRYCIVFANTWVEEGNEDESNLVGRAKHLGAICLKEDLSGLKIPRNKSVTYFLAREGDMRNLNDAIYLTGERGCEQWKHCSQATIYVYAQSDLAPEILEQIYANAGKANQEVLKLSIIPYKTNTTYRLLQDFPLYQYLEKPPAEEETLSVVIIGSDDWAVELVKAVFWCGQFPKKRLHLISVSQDGPEFEAKIRYLIPELDVSDSTAPYCRTEFLSAVPQTDAFYKLISDAPISAVPIWFVCLGDDQANMETADFIKRRLNAVHLCSPIRAIVHYQINSDNLMRTLNSAPASDQTACQTHAFASLGEQYSLDNLWGNLQEFAWMLDDAWSSKSKDQTAANEYRRRSSLASALHLQYKLYAFGLLEEENSAGWNAIKGGLKKYLQDKTFQSAHAYEIGYVEHRRWNAYMRSQGYRLVEMDEWEAYYQTPEGQARKARSQKIDSKDSGCKLHTCLVEYSPAPLADFTFLPVYQSSERPSGEPLDWSNSSQIVAAENSGRLDGLDTVSVRLNRLSAGLPEGKRPSDLKLYDTYPLMDAAEKFIIYDAFRTLLQEIAKEQGIHYFTRLRDVLGKHKKRRWTLALEQLVQRLQGELPSENMEHVCGNLAIMQQNGAQLGSYSVKDITVKLSKKLPKAEKREPAKAKESQHLGS